MKTKTISGVMLILLLTSMLTLAFNVQTVKSATTILVPDDYAKIQWAIGNASAGDTIFVRAGTYYEHLTIDKSLSFIGENRSTTIIDGNGTGTVVTIKADNVNITGFTVQNSGYTDAGIYLDHSCCSTVSDNKIATWGVGVDLFGGSENDLIENIIGGPYSWYGIRLWNSSDNVISRNLQGSSDVGVKLIGSSHNFISGNKLVFNMANGMALHGGSDNNFITENTIEQNLGGLWLDKSNGNTIYQNNFNNMEIQVSLSHSTNNTWDNGYPSGGNYWSDYSSRYPTIGDEYQGETQDILGSDGIWDGPYVIDENNQDRYPFVNPWTPTPPVVTATLDIDPDTVNLYSIGQWITAYIQLPEGYNAEDIDATTILLNGTISPVLDPIYEFVTNSSEYLVDHNEDGILERMVKFDEAEVMALPSIGEATLTITGEVNGTKFEGSDSIRVVLPPAGCGGCRHSKR